MSSTMNIVFSWYCFSWTTLVGAAILPQAADPPIQIFLLAGQSNMVGMGAIDHLDVLVVEGDNEFRRTLWNDDTHSYRERKDVYIKYESYYGKLTVSRTAGYAGKNAFGPEALFGWTVGDAKEEEEESDSAAPPIFLIKVAYGGRSLAVDFRPPSAGTGNYSGIHPVHYGWEYREMLQDTFEALENIATYVPNYNASVGYKIAGFVWFQGWNDLLDWTKVHEYEENLVKFIRDVRLDLDIPNLPFVVGELGMHGEHPAGQGADRTLALRTAQRNACTRVAHTRFVPTAQFAVLNGTNYNGIHHYNGRADTYYYIGQAFGRAMVELVREKPSVPRSIDFSTETSLG